jgi:hypothetical protein
MAEVEAKVVGEEVWWVAAGVEGEEGREEGGGSRRRGGVVWPFAGEEALSASESSEWTSLTRRREY